MLWEIWITVDRNKGRSWEDGGTAGKGTTGERTYQDGGIEAEV